VKTAAQGDPRELLAAFEKAVRDTLTVPMETVSSAKKALAEFIADPDVDSRAARYQEVARIASKVSECIAWSNHRLYAPGKTLFLTLLQAYHLPPALRKKVETVSRAYGRPTKPKSVMGEEAFVKYEKLAEALETQLDVARKALAQGKEHAEEGEGATKIKVGPFVLVNAGGFDAKVMEKVARVVAEAVSLLRAADLDRVCYGEIQITNTLSKANVLAFYHIEKDDLFVRANLERDSLKTILHELGHRFDFKFLSGRVRDLERLYQSIAIQEIGRKDKRGVPAVGETVIERGKTWKVTEVQKYGRGGPKVFMVNVDDPRQKASIALEGWFAMKGESMRDFDTNPNYEGYVSNYAKSGGPRENFAEMFAHYALGDLPVLQSRRFEGLIFGTKAAAVRLARRFSASR
jgi:hypothetical protein